MPNILFPIVLVSSAALGSTLSAAQIHVHNNAGEDVYINCSHVNTFKIHNGASRTVSYKSNVHEVRCEAHDHHNNHLDTRNFHFADHHSQITWNIGHH